jgi:hypothetical protein
MSEVICVTNKKMNTQTTVVVNNKGYYIWDGALTLYSVATCFNTTPENIYNLNRDVISGDLKKYHIEDGAKLRVSSTVTETKENPYTPPVKESKSSSCAPWMDVILSEQKKYAGQKGTKSFALGEQVKIYHSYTGSNGSGANISWCASCLNWSLREAKVDNTASAWSGSFIGDKKFVKIDYPIHGAIAVFKKYIRTDKEVKFTGGTHSIKKVTFDREEKIKFITSTDGMVTSIENQNGIIFQQYQVKGGTPQGHVTFVSALVKGFEDSYVYCIGGNQSDQIKKSGYNYQKNTILYGYPKGNVVIYSMFVGFYIPIKYKENISKYRECLQIEAYDSNLMGGRT